jgi:hypothetical protein
VSVPKIFPGETIVCIASGPSLTDADVNAVRGRARVIAINDSYRKAPFADVLYAADKDWWRFHQGVPAFGGLKFAITEPSWLKWPWPSDVTVLNNMGHLGLETDPSGLRTGGEHGANSGYQAINLAVHLGASRILLLGYDMQRTNGRLHWFGNHPDDLHRNLPFAEFLKGFPTLVKPLSKLNIEIINCTRQTALHCFQMATIDHVLSAVAA